MNVEQLAEHYGNQSKAADAINVTRAAVSKWKDTGIPTDYQIKWELATGGVLKADLPGAVRCAVHACVIGTGPKS
jgi:hypothetical protein